MSRDILVYGHGDKSTNGFPSSELFEEYIKNGVFRDEGGRYRYSQCKRADIVILSRDGLAFGHFEIDSMAEPTPSDKDAYPPAKKVYMVRKSVLYGNKVRLSDVGIFRYQFGKHISEGDFKKILAMAGMTKK
jgi:hypothetical protein